MIKSSDFDFHKVVQPGDVISWPQGPGEPLGLTRRLVAQADALPPLGIFVGMTVSDTLSPAAASKFSVIGLNGAGSNRSLVSRGLMDVIPSHVSTVPTLLRRGDIPVDVVLIRVRQTDRPDEFSLGVISDYTEALIGAARVVVAELDPRLPVTGGDALVPASAIHHFVKGDNDAIRMEAVRPNGVEQQVAKNVAALIPDRATVQLGIGGLSFAIAAALLGHRDLGVHSGVVSDVLIDMVESGAVTNAYKGIDTGVTVTGGLFGTERLNKWADGNPAISMRSVEYTHNINVMATLHAFHSINFAIEVDLSGQVNAELAAGRYLGAVGGQLDFVRGARYSEGGLSIIALPSVTPNGKISRIVTSIADRPVTTPRSDVDMIVTEHGAADLRGVPLVERRRRLIAIAHPDHREQLARIPAVAAE